ncbi:hypothetical protein C161_26845 [Paenibacillus sp. FSL R5-192]|nr:hypothetical protein C161_26845 [Paenibacillus sp. FSL R5-192]
MKYKSILTVDWFTSLNQKVCVKNWSENSGSRKILILEMMKSGESFSMVALSRNFQIDFSFQAILLKRSFIQNNSLTKVALEEILM